MPAWRGPGEISQGFTGIAYDIAGKRLELLKETVPKATRVGILVDPSAAADAHVKETEVAARAIGLKLQLIEVRSPQALDDAFRAARQERAEALSVVATGLINSHRSRVVDLAIKRRLPAIYSNGEFVLDGGLMSYAADLPDQFHRAGAYVAKILSGTRPSDLPAQQPIKFEFIVNLKSAKQIGVTIPPNVLVRADKVIR